MAFAWLKNSMPSADTLFGTPHSKRVAPKTTADNIQDLNANVELLEKRQQVLEEKAEKMKLLAKHYLKQQNKAKAAACLKRSKAFELQAKKLEDTILSLDTQKMTLENANATKLAFDSMKTVNKGLKDAHKEMNVAEVEDTMDEIQETMDDNNEITDVLSKPLLMPGMADDEDIENELAAMDAELLDETMLEAANPSPVVPAMPAPPQEVPSLEIKKEEEEDVEDELQALKASMMTK